MPRQQKPRGEKWALKQVQGDDRQPILPNEMND